MTERGLPIADAAPACPFVAFDDRRDDRSDRPDPRHRCYAESPPSPRARAHQEAYCLSPNFPVCPTFQDWARREAAHVLPGAGAGSPAERLRDVPAQRVAGERPPTFAAATGGSDWPVADPAGRTGGPAASGPVSSDAGLAPQAPDRATQAPDRAARLTDDQDPRDAGHTGDPATDDAAAGRMPWELPARRAAQPDWTAPPPWAATRTPPPGAVEPPEPPEPDEPDVPQFLRAVPERAPIAEDAAVPSGRDATMARLRALGMGTDAGSGQAPAPPDQQGSPSPRPAAASGALRGDDANQGVAIGQWPGSRPGVGATGAPGIVDPAPDGDGGGRPSGGLARILGWDRRPKAGSARPGRQPQKEPAWERPRRYEAYPTLKTRVGLPVPSRIWLAAGAVLVAAAVLFFVPPMFLKQSGGTGTTDATRTPGTSVSDSGAPVASPSRSAGPTAKPTPAQRTYKVRQGDTLSSIAKRFKISVDELLAANKQIKDPNKIAIGDVLVIPTPVPSEIVSGEASASP